MLIIFTHSIDYFSNPILQYVLGESLHFSELDIHNLFEWK